MFKNIHKLIFVVITANLCNLHCMDQQTKLTTYEQLASDIHRKIFSYLLSNCSDTEAIITAKQLGSTCTTQYNLLLNPIKKSFEEFIFSDIKFDQYTINDPLCNSFINLLPTDFYRELLNKIQEEINAIDIKINFITTYDYLSEEKVNKNIVDLNNKIGETTKTIQNLSTELQDINSAKKPLLINAAQKELNYLINTLEVRETKKMLENADLEKIKKREQYKNNLKTATFFNYFFSQDKSTDLPRTNFFKNWIDAKIDLIYLFWARTLLQPLLYTDKHYKNHAKILVKFDHYFYHFYKNIADQTDGNHNDKKIQWHIERILATNIKLIKMEILDSFPSKNYPKFPFFDHRQHTINLPHYVYGLNEQNLCMNAHWVNALYALYKKASYNKKRKISYILNNIKSKTKESKDIELTFNNACSLQYNMHKLMQYINNNNPTGTTVTIKTVSGIEHFTQYNQRFLYCLQNNQYPNITFAFQVPKQNEDETKTFFYKKPWLNWYNTLYYLNQDIYKGPATFIKMLNADDGFIRFLCQGLLFTVSGLFLCITQENQFEIFSFSTFLPTIQLLGYIGSTANQSFFLKHTVDVIPWYIIHAVLRDSLLLYSIYQYHMVNYIITAYALLELYMVQKSLFYKPLFENLYKQYKAKNTIIITTY